MWQERLQLAGRESGVHDLADAHMVLACHGRFTRSASHSWWKRTEREEDSLSSEFTGDLPSDCALREVVTRLVEYMLKSLTDLSTYDEWPIRKNVL